MSSLYYNTIGNLVAEVYPLESNGADNLSTPRLLVDVEFLDKSFIVPRDAFVISDDVSARFVQGFVFDVIGGGPYDGTYTVDASGFSPNDVVAQVVDGKTHIPVASITDTAAPVAYDFYAGFTTPSVSPTTPHNYLITWEVDGDITGTVSVNDSVQFKHILYNDNVTNARINRTYTVTGLTYSGSGYTTVVTSLTDEHSASITPVISVDAESTFVTPVPSSSPFGYVRYTVPTAATSLRLVGRGVPMYNDTMSWGNALQSNMIQLMENFANPTSPASPVPGQLWFNSAQNSMWVYYTSAWHGVVSEGVPTQGNVTMSNYTMAEVADAVTTYPYVASLTGWGNNDQEAMNLRTSDLLYIAKTGGYDADPAVRSGTMTGSLNLTGTAGINFKASGSGDLTFEATSTGGIDVLGSGSVTVAAGDVVVTAGNVTVGAGTDLVVVQNNPGNAPTITFTTATTGNNVIDLTSNMITGLSTPVDPTDAANKEYVDMLSNGIVWLSPVYDPNLFDDSLSAPPVDDGFTKYHKTFIVNGTGTGGWTGLDGHLVAWDGSTWQSVLGRPVAIGDRFGVFCEPDNDDPLSTLPAGGVLNQAGKLATVDTISPYTYTFYTPAEPDAFSVKGIFGNASAYQSPHMGHNYTFRGQYGVGSFGTGYQWIEFLGPQMIVDGNGLSYDGNVLNIDLVSADITTALGYTPAEVTATDVGYEYFLADVEIDVLGAITAGSGYVDAAYTDVPLTGGTGTGATADITVSGGAVTLVTLVNPGVGYTASDSLSADNADLGGSGAGFAVTVTSTTDQKTFTLTNFAYVLGDHKLMVFVNGTKEIYPPNGNYTEVTTTTFTFAPAIITPGDKLEAYYV